MVWTELQHGDIRLRQIPGTDDYWCGTDGHVYSTKKGHPHRLKESFNKKNRCWQVGIYRHDTRYERVLASGNTASCVRPVVRPVHVWVAECWLPARPSPAHELDHRDENRANNRPDNLRWVTKLQNVQHFKGNHPLHGCGSANTQAKLVEADIPAIRALQGVMSAKRVGLLFGVAERTVEAVWQGRTWRHVP